MTNLYKHAAPNGAVSSVPHGETCGLDAMPFGNSFPMTAVETQQAIPQSQRDCVLQPRVARNEPVREANYCYCCSFFPWVNPPHRLQPQRGCVISLIALQPQPRWGCYDRVRVTQGSSFLATLGFG